MKSFFYAVPNQKMLQDTNQVEKVLQHNLLWKTIFTHKYGKARAIQATLIVAFPDTKAKT